MGLLVYSAICYLLILFALIHCIRHPMRMKWLYMLLILMQLGWELTYTSEKNAIASAIWFFGRSSFLDYPKDGLILKILIPIGVHLYWILPKRPPKPKHGTLVMDQDKEDTDTQPAINQPT